MVYKLIEDNKGDYIDASKNRVTLLEAHEAFTPEGLNVGWTEFSSKERCMIAWKLKYEPLPEEHYEEEGN